MIYLDANATTPPEPAVVEAMLPWLMQHYGNASATHAPGRRAKKAIASARAQVAALVGAEADEILFTSGATESINSVLLLAREEWPERDLLITSTVEHAAVMESAARWERQGGRVKRVAVDPQGRLNLEGLKQALEPGRTALVSMIWANNETGVVLPMREIVALAHQAGAPVHADAVQMAGKWPLDVRQVAVDYLSLSAHKMHAPKGCGALYVNHQMPFRPLLLGGGQESGRRSGTENVPGIVAMGAAAVSALNWVSSKAADERAAWQTQFEQRLCSGWPGAMVHGAETCRLSNTTSLCLPNTDAAAMLILLDQRGIACSGGAACHSASLHPSAVLEAMGYPAEHAASTLRFSWSRLNTREELMEAADIILATAQHLVRQKDL